MMFNDEETLLANLLAPRDIHIGSDADLGYARQYFRFDANGNTVVNKRKKYLVLDTNKKAIGKAKTLHEALVMLTSHFSSKGK